MPFPELAEFPQSEAPLFQKKPHDSSRHLVNVTAALKVRWTRTSRPFAKCARGQPCVSKKAGAKIALRFKPALARDRFERKPGMPQQILGAVESQSREVLRHGNSLQPLKKVAQIVLAHTGALGYFRHAVNRSEVLLHELPSILNKNLLRVGNPNFAVRDRANPQKKGRDTEVEDA